MPSDAIAANIRTLPLYKLFRPDGKGPNPVETVKAELQTAWQIATTLKASQVVGQH